MTGPAPLDGAREALLSAIPTDRDDGTACIDLEYLGGAEVPQWGRPEILADRLLAALSSAGYQVVKVEEQWTEYGTRWLDQRPTGDSDPVRVWGDSRDDDPDWCGRGVLVEHGKDSAESAAYDWTRDGYPARVESRPVAAGPWVPVSGEIVFDTTDSGG